MSPGRCGVESVPVSKTQVAELMHMQIGVRCPEKIEAGEYTLSPDDTTRRTEPTPYVPPPPETRRPPLCVLRLVVCMLARAKELLVVRVFCLGLTAAEIKVIISVPPRYRGPVIRALLLQIKLPDTSKDGALTAQLNVALLLVIPSLSVPPESPKRSV